VPLIVIVLAAHVAEIPPGNPLAPETPLLLIPVAPVVAIVTFGDMAVLIHTDGDEDGVPAVLFALAVIVPVALILPQPPVKGML